MTIDPYEPVVAFLADIESAWNTADGERFGTYFGDVTDFVDVRGVHHHGDGSAIGAGHQAIFETTHRGSTVRYQMERARLLGPECILAHATATLDAPAGPLKGINRSTMTVVLVEEGGAWKATGFHNTLIKN